MNYLTIDKFDVINGSGIGVVLWVAGCDIHCPGCHNPETWDPAVGKKWDYAAEQELFKALFLLCLIILIIILLKKKR